VRDFLLIYSVCWQLRPCKAALDKHPCAAQGSAASECYSRAASLRGRRGAGQEGSRRCSPAGVGRGSRRARVCFVLLPRPRGRVVPGRAPQRATLSHSHGDPLLQRVAEVVLADGVCQGPQRWLELHHGFREVPEPAAQLHLLLQHPASPWKHTGLGGNQPSTGRAEAKRGAARALTCWVLACGALQGGEEQAAGQGRIWCHPFRHGVEERVSLVQGSG